SFGGAISWQLDAKEVAPKNQLAANWVLFAISVPSMLYVVWRIKEHSEDQNVEEEKKETVTAVEMD
ncbi:hypothetical protein GGF44_006606, partial [Coemansia sp. RSA 1694]